MKIQWLGHSAFLITSQSGVRVVTDPYQPGCYDGGVNYGPFNQPADIVTVSHEHPDHSNLRMVSGHPIIIKRAGEYIASGTQFLGVQSAHDETDGSERGKNIIFTFTIDGIKVCHLGDLGHILTGDQAAEIGSVDVLFIPAGGHFTIASDDAWRVVNQLAAKIVIPMHYRTEKIGADFPITGVDGFLKGKSHIKRLNSSTIELRKQDLPKDTEVIVLKPSL